MITLPTVNFGYLTILFSLIFLPLSSCFGQQSELPAVESFESEDVLKAYDKSAGSELDVSTNVHRFGKSSLRWAWTENDDFLTTNNFRILDKAESPLAYGDHFPSSPTLIFSIYSEDSQVGTITLSLGNDGEEKVWFDLPLTFTGWRHFWVPFYEMEGKAPKKGDAVEYNYFKVSSTAKSGEVFFDDIVFSQYQDDRHQYPDLLVPFIKENQVAAADHWMPMIENYERLKTLSFPTLSDDLREDLKTVEDRLKLELSGGKNGGSDLEKLVRNFKKLGLSRVGKTVLGPPLTFRQSQEYFDPLQQGPLVHNDVKDLGGKLEMLAKAHAGADHNAQKEIEQLFLLGTQYYLDQGWQAGASGGTRHHIGYAVRELTKAFYLMRKTLQKEKLLDEVGQSLQWLYNLGMVLGDEKEFHVNIDYLNTQAYYHLLLIFLTEDLEQQATLLKAYSNYLSITLAQEDEEWGFKPDGTAWHHNGHYPAYGLGAFQNVPKLLYPLSGTAFRIGEEGHRNFKRAFLATGTYSKAKDWGFGNAGRHPFEGNNINSLRKQYLEMARAGSPDGSAALDSDIASAYLRIWGDKDPLNSSVFTQINGISKEELKGYFTLPYAATAVQRRGDWAAIIKGYSKYVWASEIYVASNRYGRYPANGTVQLINKDGEKASGFQQEGWDWNRFPGATVIYLPLEELETEMPLLMFRSNESFAGAVSLKGNGVFGMVLNEDKGSNADGVESKVGFPGKLHAKKSVFSYGDKLICIGTDISSVDAKNPVQTNLFQLALKGNKMPVFLASKKLTDFPLTSTLPQDGETGKWLIDPYRNGYYILSDTPVTLQKKEQHSYHNKYSLRTGAMNSKGKGVKETEGKFASAWLDHGTEPKGASYQYVIYPDLPEQDLKKSGKKAAEDKSYTILRADGSAHIVQDNETSTTGYSIFEANSDLRFGPVATVSQPALIMAQKEASGQLTLSAVQPDLNFPEYKAGKYRNYSRPVTLDITLKGLWAVPDLDFIEDSKITSNHTIITLICEDGLPREFKLSEK